jgi:hypothetical protein
MGDEDECVQGQALLLEQGHWRDHMGPPQELSWRVMPPTYTYYSFTVNTLNIVPI